MCVRVYVYLIDMYLIGLQICIYLKKIIYIYIYNTFF